MPYAAFLELRASERAYNALLGHISPMTVWWGCAPMTLLEVRPSYDGTYMYEGLIPSYKGILAPNHRHWRNLHVTTLAPLRVTKAISAKASDPEEHSATYSNSIQHMIAYHVGPCDRI